MACHAAFMIFFVFLDTLYIKACLPLQKFNISTLWKFEFIQLILCSDQHSIYRFIIFCLIILSTKTALIK